MTNEFADLGTPIILLICDPSLVLYTPTVLSVKNTTANFQHLDNLAVLGQEFLRICAQTSCWIKSNTQTASFVIINAYLSSPPSCRSLTPMRTDILPLLQHGFHYILVYNFIRIESMEKKVDLSSDPEQITDLQVKSYMQCFLDINDFKKTDNAKSLLELIRANPDHSRIKSMLRTVVGMFNCNEPAARVCSLQFLKQALQTGSYFVLQTIEKNVLNKFSEIVQYRSGVKGLSKGSTYFIREIDKNIEDEEFMTLVRLSSTFFRMVQECLYVWGALYFPGSAFDRLRLKMGTKLEVVSFPKDFKFFSETKINNFKSKCQNLIKKLQERKTQSMMNSKKSIINKQIDRNSDKQSEINSKKQQQTSRKRQKSEQNIENLPSSSRGQKKLPSKKKKEKKKFVDSDEQKQKLQHSTLSNNSSKLRKKNSFDETHTAFNRNPSPQSSSELKRQQNSLKVLAVTKQINLAQPITQRQQSEGGRYSIKQSSASEQLKDICQNQKESSPRSQFSATQVQPQMIGFKRQISQQLSHPTAHANNYKRDDKNIVIKSRGNLDPKIERVNNKISIRLPIDQGKRKLKDEENQQKDKAIKSSKRKKIQNSAPKRFVSSEQQNHIDQKQSLPKEANNKAIKIVQMSHFYEEEDNLSNLSKFDKKKQIKPAIQLSKKDSAKSNRPEKVQLIEAKSINSSPQNLKGPIKQNYQNNTNYLIQPVKIQRASKPQKIKSNTNLQTVFESTDFKVISNKQPAKSQRIIQKVQILKPKQKNQMKKIDIFAEAGPKGKQKSIFDAVQMSSIKKAQQISLIKNHIDQKNQNEDINLEEKDKVAQHLYQQNNSVEQTQSDAINNNEQSQKQYESSQYSNLQKQDDNKITNGGNYIKQSIDQPKAKQVLRNKLAKSHNYNQIQTKVDNKKQSNPHKIYSKPNSIKTSRQFRHFKQVNLFIDPQSARLEPSFDSHEPLKIDSEQIESALKEKIVQEFHKLKKELIIKQQQNLNNTITSLKSQIEQSKQGRLADKNQCSTQTKNRHKSKSKFEKNRVKLIEEDLFQNKNDQNNPKNKFSKTSAQSSHQNHHLTNIGNHQPYYYSNQLSRRQNEKKQQNIRQQMKPNTLLYALYRRKSINI